MKLVITILATVSIAYMTSCDMRSGTAKEEMEKFSGTPTPTTTPMATPTPIDPADSVQVDTTLEGETITVNRNEMNKTVSCKKYDQVMINATGGVANISGVCSQIMVNGNGNKITIDAAAEFVFNGTDNTLKYARFANGKQPIVTQNQSGNNIEKIPYQPGTNKKNASGK